MSDKTGNDVDVDGLSMMPALLSLALPVLGLPAP
jgi:hypothetical protein